MPRMAVATATYVRRQRLLPPRRKRHHHRLQCAHEGGGARGGPEPERETLRGVSKDAEGSDGGGGAEDGPGWIAERWGQKHRREREARREEERAIGSRVAERVERRFGHHKVGAPDRGDAEKEEAPGPEVGWRRFLDRVERRLRRRR